MAASEASCMNWYDSSFQKDGEKELFPHIDEKT